jgi:hypothetical protein
MRDRPSRLGESQVISAIKALSLPRSRGLHLNVGEAAEASPMAATRPHKVTAYCARAAYFLGLYSGTCSPPNMKLIPRLSRIKR